MNKLQKLWYSCKEIGMPQMAEYAVYLLQKKTGSLVRKTPLNGAALDFDPQEIEIKVPFDPFNPDLLKLLEDDRQRILQSADEILSGWYHPFGGAKAALTFDIGVDKTLHWSAVGDQVNGQDIKWLWEPARFTWAFDLAKAWLLTKDDRYPRFFWEKFSECIKINPVNSAPNYSSAQENAMRIIVWVMVYQVFKESTITTTDHKAQLIAALWHQAARIPATVGYARSQNNNHLISEAMGLVIAGSLFSDKSSLARNWLKNGFIELNRAFLKQIEPDGTYSQHSANYHRLMLQLALIYRGYAKFINVEIPQEVSARLSAATVWLAAQLDETSGRLPNLGHNDGSLLLPFGSAEFRDYRPTLQASVLAFLGQPCLPAGQWDELALWLGLHDLDNKKTNQSITSPTVHVLRSTNKTAVLRGVTFRGRPAHADQLHLDLWWDGLNIAQDAGTFVYNDAPPWQNPFSSTLVHNTISVDDFDQMERASKFLWLRQAQAQWHHAPSKDILMASHTGYKRLGVIPQRIVTLIDDHQLQVIDQVKFIRKSTERLITLHWLLADGQWQWDGDLLTLQYGSRQVNLNFNATLKDDASPLAASDLSIIRAGETLAGQRQNPILGWASDTYGEKHPALSLSIQYITKVDMQIVTRFEFSNCTPDSQG